MTLAAEGDEIDEGEHVKMLAALLNSLIARDGEHPAHVPGALLLLIARATGSMDVPVPSFSSFRERTPAVPAPPIGRRWRRCSSGVSRSGRIAVSVLRGPTTSGARFENSSSSCLRRHRPIRRAEIEHVTRAAAVLATAALVASFMIGLHVIAPIHRPRNPPDVSLPRPQQSPPAAASPDPRSSVPPSATPARPQPASRSAVSVTPVLTAATMGSDSFRPRSRITGTRSCFTRDVPAARSCTCRSTTREAFNDPQDGAANFHAVRSPDGQRLADDSDRDGTRAVYVARADGRDATKISGVGYAAAPRWSPDGGRVAFIRAEAGRPRVWNVWIADSVPLSDSGGHHYAVGQAWGASWFPDGTHLAYSVEDRLAIPDLPRGTRRIIASPIRGRLLYGRPPFLLMAIG